VALLVAHPELVAQFEELRQKEEDPLVAVHAPHWQTQEEQSRQVRCAKTKARDAKIRQSTKAAKNFHGDLECWIRQEKPH
jgi:hypothetical protein